RHGENPPLPRVEVLGRWVAPAVGARSLGRLGLGASGRGRRGLLADRGRRAVELAQDLAVALVGEPLPRLAGGEPLEPVDLLIGQETAPERGHQPVAHQLPAAVAVAIGRVADLPAHAHSEPGLLFHLAHGGVLEVLARIELALGQAPAVVLRPADSGYLVCA